MPVKALTNAILALHATAHLEQGKELPSRLLICPWGVTDTNKGRIVCNSTTLSELPLNNKRAKRDRVAIDFNHNTVEGSPAYKGEPAKVAAYANFEIVEGEGIYLTAIDWTPEGKEHAANGHYPDLSPAIATNEKGEVIFLHSAGLARQGEIDGIVLFSAPGIEQLIKTFSSPDESMDYKKLLLTILGLSADASDEDIKNGAASLADKVKTMSAGTAAAEDIKALSARLQTLEENLKTLSTTSLQHERKAITDRAIREGKVIPLSAEQIEGLDLKTLSALVDGLPVTVPMDKRTPDGVKEFNAGTFNPSAAAADEIRENLGISKEAWDKHNAA